MFQNSMLCILLKLHCEKMQVKKADNILVLHEYSFHLTGPLKRGLGAPSENHCSRASVMGGGGDFDFFFYIFLGVIELYIMSISLLSF